MPKTRTQNTTPEAEKQDPKRADAIRDLERLTEEAVLNAPAAKGTLTPEDLKPKKRGRRKKDDGEEGEDKEDKKKGPTRAQLAVSIALEEGASVFRDPDGKTCIDTPPSRRTGRRTFRVRAARPWLSALLYEREGLALTPSQAQEAEAILEALAYNTGEPREVYTRLAHHEGRIYLDLGDETWDAVQVTAEGWKIVSSHPVRFVRPSSLRPLPRPIDGKGTGWGDFRRIMHNPKEEDFILLVAWLVGTLSKGPYTILALASEQGTGKTTQGKLLRRLVDPNKAELRPAPSNEKDLMIQAENSLICGFDNLSSVPQWLSDALCRLSTGAGFSSRELYTDAGEVILSARRPVILTSIGTVTNREDLAERSVPVRLPFIPEEARRAEEEVFREAEAVTPQILGALLDAVSVGLRRLETVQKSNLPRMADFCRWVMACEPALPWEEGRFLEVYRDALEQSVIQGIENNPLAKAIVDLLEGEPGRRWTGGLDPLLRRLKQVAGIVGEASPVGWPRSNKGLGGSLDRVMPLLRSAHGIELHRHKHPDLRSVEVTLTLPARK